MKKLLFLSMFLVLHLYAENLTQILNAIQSSKKTKAILEKSKSDILQNEQFSKDKAPLLSASLAHADALASDAQDGLEYGISFSQELSHPFSSSQKDTVVGEYTKAIQQETRHELHILTLNVASAYHTACVSLQMQEKSSFLYTEQQKRFEQIQSAYVLGEISKKDLLFNKLDLRKLRQNVSAYKRMYIKDMALVQSYVDNINIRTLSCEDIVEPKREIKLNPIEEHGELKVLEYKKNSSKALYDVYESSLSSLSYEIAFEEELDTRRYTVGLSIPLDSMSSLKEKEKAQHLALSTSYIHEKDSLRLEIEHYSSSAIAKLEVLYDEYILIKDEVLPLNKELVSLSKTALLEGEGDMMEYLDSTRSYSLNLLEMLEIKKFYYTELFDLYKIADLEFGEKK